MLISLPLDSVVLPPMYTGMYACDFPPSLHRHVVEMNQVDVKAAVSGD